MVLSGDNGGTMGRIMVLMLEVVVVGTWAKMMDFIEVGMVDLGKEGMRCM